MNAYTRTYGVPRGNSGGPVPQGFWASAGGAYTQNPQENQTTAFHLNNLIAGDSDYIQQARRGAQAQAASRGMGNSSYAAGNAQGAAIRAAAPIAQADAGMFANAALANQDALNKVLMSDRQNMTSIQQSNIAAGASMYGADRSLEGSKYNTKYSNDMALTRDQQDREFKAQFDPYMLELQNYYGAQDWSRDLYGSILQGAYGTMFSNPDYFQDPNAAMGFVNGFGNFAGNQIDQYLYGNP
jgi:hypothetical protein